MQPSAFGDEIAEDVVLKRAVFPFARNSARNEALIDIFNLCARGIAESRGAEIGHLELHGDAAAFRILFQHLADELQVIREGGGKFADILLLHPAVQHLFLQRNVDAFVRIARRLTLIVERPHKRIGKENPGKTLLVEVVGHHGAVRHRTLNVDFVENRVEVGCAGELLLQFGLLVEQPFRVLGREIGVGISEQSLGSRRRVPGCRRACAALRWRSEARPWRRRRDRRRSRDARGDRRPESFRSAAAGAGKSAARRDRGTGAPGRPRMKRQRQQRREVILELQVACSSSGAKIHIH